MADNLATEPVGSAEDSIAATEAPEVDETSLVEESTGDVGSDVGIDAESDTLTEREEEPAEVYYEIDGEEVSLDTIREWKAGGMRQSDYTQKTQSLAADRKGIETEKIRVGAQARMLQELESEIETLVAGNWDEEEMAALLESDSEEYLRRKEGYEASRRRLANLAQKRATLQNQIHAENYDRLSRSLGWEDKAKREQDLSTISSYAEAQNVTEQEFAQFTHPAIMHAFLEASAYRKLKAEAADTKKRVLQAPKSPSPARKDTSPPKVRSLAERMYPKHKG